MAQVSHAVDQPAQILRDATADVQVDHPVDKQPAERPTTAQDACCKFLIIWLHSFVMWPSFQYHRVELVPVSMSFQLLLFSLFYSLSFFILCGPSMHA